MANKMKNYMNYIFLLAILLVVSFLYNRYKDKIDRENDSYNYEIIQQYLLTGEDLVNNSSKITKPILWILISYHYNSRFWKSFGSRSSHDLNQQYIYLTVRSIIQQCSNSFHICIIDDHSFPKLLPDWKIQMNLVADPVKYGIRELGMMKLLHRYGGIRVPSSFVCMRDLKGLYELGTSGGKPFICEMVDRNITSTDRDFYPNIHFMGCLKESNIISNLIDFMQRTLSSDYTSELWFLGEFNRWCNCRVEKGQMTLIDGKLIGTKTMDDTTIIIDTLFSDDYIDLYSQTYGIYIPDYDVLNRTKYQWFARLSQKQLLQSSFVLSKYILLANAPDAKQGVIEPMKQNPGWVSFWKVPSNAPVWGLKPNDLGNNIAKERYPQQFM